jgi:hypothetical protein
MRWVKFSERFPSTEDTTSVSSDGYVFIRSLCSANEAYGTIEKVSVAIEFNTGMRSVEWLEGAFKVEVKQ